MHIQQHLDGATLTLSLEGRLDTSTAPTLEAVIGTDLANVTHLILDLAQLNYVSSAGLRVILKAQKAMNRQGDMVVRNVSPSIMEVFEMTGFSDILTIEKPNPYKQITLDPSKKIGQGATGAVYQYQEDSIIKLYFSDSALADIEREKQCAREAFILGLPTAISLGIVQVGDQFGLEYEFVKSRSLAGEIMARPGQTADLARQMVDITQALHSTPHQSGNRPAFFPSIKEFFFRCLSTYPIFTPEEQTLCTQFIASIPERDTLLHGDLHPGNIMLSDGEPLFIDVADLSYGHPIFDLATLYLLAEPTPDIPGFLDENGYTVFGMTAAKGAEFWHDFTEIYFAHITSSEEKTRILEQIAALAILRSVCLLCAPGLAFPKPLIDHFQDAFHQRLMPVIARLTGSITW